MKCEGREVSDSHMCRLGGFLIKPPGVVSLSAIRLWSWRVCGLSTACSKVNSIWHIFDWDVDFYQRSTAKPFDRSELEPCGGFSLHSSGHQSLCLQVKPPTKTVSARTTLRREIKQKSTWPRRVSWRRSGCQSHEICIQWAAKSQCCGKSTLK